MDIIFASVIIPCFNSDKTIKETIVHLKQQTAYGFVKEILIVDSSDNEESRQLLRGLCDDKIRMITSGVKVIPAIQRNIGAKEAQGDVFCFIDSDAYPAPDWIERIIENYKSGHKVGGGSYAVPYFQHNEKLAYAQYYMQFNEFLTGSEAQVKRFVPSCNLYCGKDLFFEAGMIPPLRAAEDVMFGLNVSKVSPLFYDPKIIVYHIFNVEPSRYENNQKLLGKYVYVYRKKEYDSVYLKKSLIHFSVHFILLVKTFWMIRRIVKAGNGHFSQFLKISGLFFLGMNYWRKGFIEGCMNFDNLKDD